MKLRPQGNNITERFCTYMSRHHPLARLGDVIGDLLLSPRLQPALAGHGSSPRPSRRESMSQVHMAIGPMPENNHGPAPNVPTQSSNDSFVNDTGDRPGWWNWLWHSAGDHDRAKRSWDKAHTTHGCSDPQYHGMHGRPCKFEGGSDNKCPAGTFSGWYWTYDCPGVGKVYYIDCCGGGTPKNSVWCNWTQETNWCIGYGKAAQQTPAVDKYFCTLSVLDRDMRTTAVPGGQYEVVGVDP